MISLLASIGAWLVYIAVTSFENNHLTYTCTNMLDRVHICASHRERLTIILPFHDYYLLLQSLKGLDGYLHLEAVWIDTTRSMPCFGACTICIFDRFSPLFQPILYRFSPMFQPIFDRFSPLFQPIDHSVRWCPIHLSRMHSPSSIVFERIESRRDSFTTP